MRYNKFERAARTRKSIAIFIALLFHLGLIGYIAFNQEANTYIHQLFAADETVEATINQP